jgi:AraC-like DNA-binding protein
MTLGQLRAKILLARAEAILKGTATVGTIAGELGFTDANYFARWFRKQTGKSPTQWRRSIPVA